MNAQLLFAALGVGVIGYYATVLLIKVGKQVKEKLKASKESSIATALEQAKYSIGQDAFKFHASQLQELNHIKGQLQTLQQEVMALKFSIDSPKQLTPDPIYLESLAGLSKASQTTLERQDKIEKLLVSLISTIKDLTSR